MYHKKYLFFFLFFLLFTSSLVTGKEQNDFNGQWQIIPTKSSNIDLYGTMSVEISMNGNHLDLIQKWGTSRSFNDTVSIDLNGKSIEKIIDDRVFPTNVFMGLSLAVGKTKKTSAYWSEDKKTLFVKETYPVLVSQGKKEIEAIHAYKLINHNELLQYTVERTSRKKGPILEYILKKQNYKNAYVYKVQNGWEVKNNLDKNALLISLQGIVNKNGPLLYFIYPEDWPFTYTQPVFDFYKNDRNYTFTEIKSLEQALSTFSEKAKGYIVWDPDVRSSLIVAFTASGLTDAVVISPALIPLAEEYGLKQVIDFRGQFTGQTDAEIYQWAYDQYWDQCSKDYIIWMGGDSGPVMKPGVADWGIYNKTFFNDLSSLPADTAEYALANRLLAEMNPTSVVMGWHSYAKDKERDHVKLTSHYGHRVEGLHTLPNLSFSSQVPASPGFEYKNHHNIVPGKEYKPENKVYITCVQTDGIGLGAWTKPGRGEIPYAWEVTMNYQWMAPAMLEFFYSQATPNDYFIGCLSGPGYVYPKAVPQQLLPPLIDEAWRLMKLLDLNIFMIMDYSEGATVEGNTELTENVVDAYYKGMPEAAGFLNGYAPAFTFTVRDKKPFISYDYYLSPSKPEDEAVADIYELADLNSKRPYFLLFHVRESSDIKRVKRILDKLGSEFELVPLDIFVKMVGNKPTFKERYLDQ